MGERFDSLKLFPDKKYLLFSNDSINYSDIPYNPEKEFLHGIDSLPFIMSMHPVYGSTFGILMLNSGPIQTSVYEEKISFELVSGVINLFIFSGPTPKEAIVQLQNTIGIPFLPPYSSLEWTYFDQQNNAKDEFIENSYSIEEKSSLSFLFSQNILLNFTIETNTNLFLSPKIRAANDSYSIQSIRKFFFHKFDPKPILNNKNFFLNSYNLVGITEAKKYYNTFLTQRKIQRPVVCSTHSFVGSSLYSAKWIRNAPYSFEGMKLALQQGMMHSMFGNPYVLININANNTVSNELDSELAIRWAQLFSVFPFSSLENIMPISEETKSKLQDAIKFKYMITVYLYSYFIKISNEGGSIIRPIFFDLKAKNNSKEIQDNVSQFMLGSNLMIIPALEYGIKQKLAIFSEEKFFDFYSGEVVNPKGEGFYNVTFPLERPTIYLKSGFITPFQLLDYEENNIPDNISLDSLKDLPLQVIIALDSNYHSNGRILIDDFVTTEAKFKKNYYKMDISTLHSSTAFTIFFKVFSLKYKLPPELYLSTINKIIIFGFSKISVKKVTIISQLGRIDLGKKNFSFYQANDILIIKNIEVKLDMDTKILIV